MTPIRKLLIANRGEIAVRIARTCRDLGIASVAVFSDVDDQAMHVAACDEAVRLGGDTPATSYLRVDAVIEAARRVGADAVHPGFGFLAERADAARQVEEAGLVWVGPTADVIAQMGDKLAAKAAMEAAGVPVLPGVAVTGSDDQDLVAMADDLGYPLLVKAAAGGGGKGMRRVDAPEELVDAVEAAAREAEGAFGDGAVFLERLVVRPRHVEIQIIGDGTEVVHLGERDCSVQRRHQKVVEEAPAPFLPEELVRDLRQAAVTAGRAIGYTNAGTVEFIVDGRPDAEHRFAFLEVNTRLQVEHPVTEAVTGLDLVALQLRVAEGRPLGVAQEDVRLSGHAIEVRLYAENPANDYLPAAGTLTRFRPADGPGIRWDTGVSEGDRVSPHYDPMIAKVIAHGPSRHAAAARLSSALRRTQLLGLATNRDLLVAVLEHPAFLGDDPTTSFLADHFPDPATRFRVPTEREATLAAVIAAIMRATPDEASAPVPPGFSNTGLGAERVEVTVGGRELVVELDLGRDPRVRVGPDDDPGSWRSIGLLDRSPEGLRIELDGHRLSASVVTDGDDVQVVLPDANVTLRLASRFPSTAVSDAPGTSRAPMPGVVVAVEVEEGQTVDAGDLLAIVEAMKMEHRITADVAGTVASVAVRQGQQLDADDLLVVIEPADAPE